MKVQNSCCFVRKTRLSSKLEELPSKGHMAALFALLLLAGMMTSAAKAVSWRPTPCPFNGADACVISAPVPCPVSPLNGARFQCSIVDLRIQVAAPANSTDDTDYGLLVRFFVPDRQPAGQGTPLLLKFHGTGSCGLDGPVTKVGCSCSPDIPCNLGDSCKVLAVASEGVLVAAPAERGTSHCYAPGDPMSPSATW